jgi:hypothetical protein
MVANIDLRRSTGNNALVAMMPMYWKKTDEDGAKNSQTLGGGRRREV